MVRLPGEKEQRSKRKEPRTKIQEIIIFNEQREEKPVKEVRKDICNAYYQNINIQITKRTATNQYKRQYPTEKKKKFSKGHREKIHRRPE